MRRLTPEQKRIRERQGSTLAEIRAQRRLSLTDAAKAARIGPDRLWLIEHGKRPVQGAILALALAYGMTTNELREAIGNEQLDMLWQMVASLKEEIPAGGRISEEERQELAEFLQARRLSRFITGTQ